MFHQGFQIGGLQPILRDTDNAAMLQCTIAGGRTKGANDERSFVFVHQHGGNDVTTYGVFSLT